ncbi:heparan-alpha-glucosaminide N-acetyltransferase domain-containing protein [Blastococcus sp. SYSU D01042]
MTRTVQPAALAHACAPDDPITVAGPPPAPAPVPRSPARLIGIDAARGVALIGMMAVHTMEPLTDAGTPSPAWTLAAGKSAALFAVLAGVGIALSTGGRRRPTLRTWPAQAAGLLVRAALVGAVGLLLGALVPADFASVILPYYALLFVLAIPLLTLSPRALVELAVLIGVGMPILSHLVRTGPDVRPTVPNLTFQAVADDPAGVLRDLALTGAYPALPWMAYLCAGLAVGRLALSSRRTIVHLIVTGAVLAGGAQLLSWFLLDGLGGRAELRLAASDAMSASEFAEHMAIGWSGTTPTDTGWWLATVAPHSTTPLDLAFTIGLSLVVLGVAVLLGRAVPGYLKPLAAAGSMTLTLYCLHLVMLSHPETPEGLAGFGLQVAVVVLFALVWRRYHARGPLEEIVGRAASAVRRPLLPGGRRRAPAPPGAPAVPGPEPDDAPGRQGVPAGATTAAPRAGARLLGVDAARGLALLFIMVAHLIPNISFDGRPTASYVVGGYGAAMFVLLAGVGIALATGGPRPVTGRRRREQVVTLVVRAIAIASVGLALGYVVSPEEDAIVILASFGVMFLLAVPLLGLTARGAAIAAVAIAVVVPVLVHLAWDELPKQEAVNHTFGDLVGAPVDVLSELTLTGTYPALPWMAFVCAGIAVGRLRDLTSERTAAKLVVVGVAMAAAGRLASWLLLDRFGGLAALERSGAEDLVNRTTWGPGPILPRPSGWWLAVDASYSGLPLDLLHSTGVALAVLGLVLLVARSTGSLLRPLAAVGSMTLSLYAVHLLGVSLWAPPWRDGEILLVHVAVAFVVAWAWLRAFGRGPLEGAIAGLASWAGRQVLGPPPPGGGPDTGSPPPATGHLSSACPRAEGRAEAAGTPEADRPGSSPLVGPRAPGEG